MHSHTRRPSRPVLRRAAPKPQERDKQCYSLSIEARVTNGFDSRLELRYFPDAGRNPHEVRMETSKETEADISTDSPYAQSKGRIRDVVESPGGRDGFPRQYHRRLSDPIRQSCVGRIR